MNKDLDEYLGNVLIELEKELFDVSEEIAVNPAGSALGVESAAEELKRADPRLKDKYRARNSELTYAVFQEKCAPMLTPLDEVQDLEGDDGDLESTVDSSPGHELPLLRLGGSKRALIATLFVGHAQQSASESLAVESTLAHHSAGITQLAYALRTSFRQFRGKATLAMLDTLAADVQKFYRLLGTLASRHIPGIFGASVDMVCLVWSQLHQLRSFLLIPCRKPWIREPLCSEQNAFGHFLSRRRSLS